MTWPAAGAIGALQAELRAEFAATGDPTRAVGQQRYMKSSLPFAGVAMAEVRRIAKRVGRAHPVGLREQFETGMRRIWDEAEVREERYAVIAVTGLRDYAAWQDPDLVALYRHFVVTGAWWDLVDDVTVHRVAPIRRAYPHQVDPMLTAWAADDDLWLRRAAVLSQVGSGAALDTGVLGAVLEPNLDRREFFLRKAVGWALRDASARHPDWVLDYVTGHRDRLSPLSAKEATRHLPPR